jgi:hypothetical protein
MEMNTNNQYGVLAFNMLKREFPGNRPILGRFWASTAFTGADNVRKNQTGYRIPVLAQYWAVLFL